MTNCTTGIRMTMAAATLAAATGVALGAVPAAQANGTPALCGVSKTVTLKAGQTIDSGTVTVGNDSTNLYVKFATTSPWLLDQTHVHAADSPAGIPVTSKGNPVPGQFAYQATHVPPVPTYTYTIPRGALSIDNNNGYTVAAHAALSKIVDGAVIQAETGWGQGTRFTDRGSWGMYFGHTWQTCTTTPPPSNSKTETAFATMGGTNENDGDQTTCFTNLGPSDDAHSDRWGWTNGPLGHGTHNLQLYAAAGKCDTTKGTLVGTVKVEYAGSSAKVTYTTTAPYSMTEAHLYVGSTPLPFNNQNEPTTATGQFPVKAEELKSATSYSATVNGLSGGVYVVAHASVAGFTA